MSERTDSPSILNEDWLWRRVTNQPNFVKPMPDGQWRVSSAAFKDGHTGEISFHLARLAKLEKIEHDFPDVGVVSLQAFVPRENGCIVVADPEEHDPSHVLVCPGMGSGNRARAAKKMAEAAQWMVKPLIIREPNEK